MTNTKQVVRYQAYRLERTARGWECWVLDCHGRETWTAHATRGRAILWGEALCRKVVAA